MRTEVHPKSIRNLSGSMGEITAYLAGVEVMLLEAKLASPVIDERKLHDLSKKHSVHLSGVSAEKLWLSHSRLSILNIYSAFDTYLGALRKEHKALHGKSWTQHDGDTPPEALKRNAPDKAMFKEEPLSFLLITIDYYRLVRNIVAHPRDNNKNKPIGFYKTNRDKLSAVNELFQSGTAPNIYPHLVFEDIKLFARVVLTAADKINEAYAPSQEQLVKAIPEKYRFKKLLHDKVRRKKSIASYLRMEYGLKIEYAEVIADRVLAY